MESRDDLTAVGREIAKHRRAVGLSQAQLADRCGMHLNYIGLLERGRRNPSLTTLLVIAAALDLSLSDMFANLPKSERSDGPQDASKC